MNHPTREEWMEFLYGEHRANNEMKAHLAACNECQASVARWKLAMKSLDSWRLSAAPPVRSWQPVVKWAAAAMLILAAGFGFGRTVSPSRVDAAQIRAAIEPSLKASLETELRQKLALDYQKQLREELDRVAGATIAAANAETTRLLSGFANATAEKRTEEAQAILAALKEMETKRVNDYAGLRKELETVAVLTEFGLRNAQRDIVQLASITQPNSADSTQLNGTPNK